MLTYKFQFIGLQILYHRNRKYTRTGTAENPMCRLTVLSYTLVVRMLRMLACSERLLTISV